VYNNSMAEEQNESLEIKWARLDEKMDFVLQEIKSMRDGTYADIQDLKKSKADNKEVERIQGIVNEIQHKLNNNIENRVSILEGTKADFRQKLSDNGVYIKFLIGLGILMFGVLLWHIVGYHI